MRQMQKGIALEELLSNTKPERLQALLTSIAALSQRGLVKKERGRLFLTSLGVSVENEIVVNLYS